MKLNFSRTDDFLSIIELGKDGPFKNRNNDYFEVLMKFECAKESLKIFHINEENRLEGYLFYNIFHLENNPKVFFLEIYLKKLNGLSETFKFAIEEIKRMEGESIVLMTEDTEIEQLQFFQEYGAKIILEMVNSELELNNYISKEIRLDEKYRIYNFKELKEKWGESVYERILPIVKNVLMDTPGSEEAAKALSLEMLKNAWSGTQFLEEGSLFLLDGDSPVGIHNIVSLEDGEVTAGVTGILREYRRKGLMRALKSKGISWAKKRGYKKFVSNNEKDNPMLQLNYELGFKKVSSSFQLKYEICSHLN